MTEAEEWFQAPESIDVGQVAGVDVDKDGNVFIFHRGSTVWDEESFDRHDNFLLRDQGTDVCM